MRRLMLVAAAAGLLGAAGFWYAAFQHGPPTAALHGLPARVGNRLAFTAEAVDPNLPGLRRVEIFLRTAAGEVRLARRDFPSRGLLGSGVRRVSVAVDRVLDPGRVPEGEARIDVFVVSWARTLLGADPAPAATGVVHVDHTPPALELVSATRHVRVGGSGVAVLRAGEDAVQAGVAAGDYFFPAVRGPFRDPALAVAIFAVPQDLPDDVPLRAEAADSVGNRRLIDLPVHVAPQRFRTRRITVSDSFLKRKIPPLASENGLRETADLVELFLQVNRDLRRRSETRIRELAAHPEPRPLWSGPFLQQPGSKTMSRFADRRIYVYDGDEIDRQTHLGYDLASTRHAPVVAAQDGLVRFAGPLGIYGTTILLDHGLGLATLYAHLSSVEVSPGQPVRAGQVIARTGETGLAGGDHLHFSVLVHGVHVDPREWWDPKWVQDHVLVHLEPLLAARPGGATPPPAPGAPPPQASNPAAAAR